MASTVWKGYFSFGLISVPIRLYVAARESHVSFNQIHQVCGTRVKQQLFCPHCERVVERNEIAKGYPIDKDTYLQVTEQELRTLEAASSETMEIVQFVKLSEVDPLYFQSSYFTVAEEPGQRAYSLIHQGMQHLGLGAIAKITLHQREQIVMIRPYDKGMVLHTLFFAEEVREFSEYVHQPDVKVQKAEVELAEQFMKQLTGKFDPEQFKDEYQSRVEALVESKQAGMLQLAEKPEKPRQAKVIDLMEALKKSMEQNRQAQRPEPEPERVADTGVKEMPIRKAPQRAASAGRKKKTGSEG